MSAVYADGSLVRLARVDASLEDLMAPDRRPDSSLLGSVGTILGPDGHGWHYVRVPATHPLCGSMVIHCHPSELEPVGNA